MRPQFTDRCTFGLASMQSPESARQPLMDYVHWLGERAEVKVSTRFLDSYANLAAAVRDGTVDVAWLPPVVYVALERRQAVAAMVSNHRAGQAAFHGALLVHAGAHVHTLDGIRGSRVAWVDPCSASGYVMPRLQLAALGIDPRKSFSSESFFGSHDGVVRAVAEGDADVGATFARVDGAGNVTSGSWSQIPEVRGYVRVLWTLGAIPSDVIAARAGYPSAVRDRLADAFVASTNEARTAPLARRLFGVEEFRRGHMKSYASLRRAIEKGSDSALIDALPLESL
ncbi:MAG TPA: phosphate/phosphite/phosphonate ABC transporter substrate-binding protein [Polyangiaceae bacterium]|jgi:phosphate/phosphite/phosphonate ABC transporter binding protein